METYYALGIFGLIVGGLVLVAILEGKAQDAIDVEIKEKRVLSKMLKMEEYK